MQSVSEETPVEVGEIATTTTVEANSNSNIPEVNIINETSPRKRRSDNSSSSEGELDMEKKEKYRKTLRLNSELIVSKTKLQYCSKLPSCPINL